MKKTLHTPRNLLNAFFFTSPSQLDVRTGGSQRKLTAHFALSGRHKLKFDVYHEPRSRSSCLARTSFAAFGKGMQLIRFTCDLMMISNSLDLGGCEEDVAYP